MSDITSKPQPLNMAEYNAIEVKSVKVEPSELHDGEQVIASVTVCEPEEADMWSVYLRRADNNEAYCLADTADKKDATLVASAMQKAHPHLTMQE